MSDTRSTIATAPPQIRVHAAVSAPDPDALSRLVDALPDGVLFLDRDWRITFANPAARRVSRISYADYNHKTHWELYPETVGTELERVYRGVMMSGTAACTEHFYEPFNVWLDIQVLPTDDGIALYYRDVTDRKRAEALQEEFPRQLQQVFDASADSIVCLDKDWNCTFANRTARRLLKQENLTGANFWTGYPGNQAEPFASNYRTTMEQRTPTDFEAYSPEPLDLWFRVLARPFEDGIIIFSRDISDKKRSEAVRDAAARQLQQVLEATTDAVISLDWNWTITYLNHHAATVLGRGDLEGKNLWEVFPLALGSDFHTNYHQTMVNRTPRHFEAFYPAPLNLWFTIQCRPSDDGIVVFFRDITADRTAKQVLLDQQATLAFVQKTARIATWTIDLATGGMTYGDGSFDVFGCPLAQLLTIADVRQRIAPSHSAAVDACVQKAIDTHTTTTADYPVPLDDGSTLWVESRGTAIYDAAGVATHVRGMITDITARRQDEEKLLASEARYRVLADLNPQALWIGAPDGAILYANQGFLDYIGKTLGSIAGLGWLDAFDPADRDRVVAAWTHSVATGEEYLVDSRLIRASDGAARWWTLRGLPVRDEAGVIQQWLGVANDIHESRTAAELLREKQEQTERQRAELETVYRTAPIGLALFDPVEFRYLRLNDRQAEIVGLPPEQVIGRLLTDVAPIEGLREMFEQVAAGHPVQDSLLEGELTTRPGEHRYWNVNYFPVYGPDGTVQAITAASLEVTHQKKSEAALIQSEKLAAVGRLASSISHEINNPLEAITNLLFLIALDESLPDPIKLYVQTAQSELTRVSQIVTQTLRFHRQAVKPTSVTAADLVNAVLNLYQGRLTNSGIRVEARYTSETSILCFENDIRQVLNNLIANAIDAMRSGGRLLVRAHDTTDVRRDPDTGAPLSRPGVRITIADTGHGMSPEVRARIFEPFYTTKALNGTGLGLWISSGIVTHHQGRLTVRSSQHPTGHGTIFSLFLPTKAD